MRVAFTCMVGLFQDETGMCLLAPQYFVLNKGDRLDRTAQLKPMMYLRGIQQTFIDLARNPEIVECIRDHVVNYFLEYNPKVLRPAAAK